MLPRSLGASAAAVPSGLRGKAQAAAPAQFSLTASQALPAWLCAQPRKRAGDRGGGGRARPAWIPGKHNWRDLQRAARSHWRVLSTPRQGSPGSPKESPLFRTGQGPPDLDCIKVRKCPSITRTNSSRRGLQTVLGQSGSAVQVAKGGFLNGRYQGIDFRFWLAHWEPQVFTPLTY